MARALAATFKSAKAAVKSAAAESKQAQKTALDFTAKLCLSCPRDRPEKLLGSSTKRQSPGKGLTHQGAVPESFPGPPRKDMTDCNARQQLRVLPQQLRILSRLRGSLKH